MSRNEDRRVCCIEGFYEYEGQEREPTINPMLKMLSQWGYWPSPAHKKCKTVKAAQLFMETEWRESACGSVLFFATHGSPDQAEITLSGEQSVSLDELGNCLANQCQGRLVHFSACYVLRHYKEVKDFLRKTNAVAVSGYRTDVGWAEANKPALLSDLMLLNELWESNPDFSNGRSFRPKLSRIEGDLQRRFGDCQFEIVQS